MKRQVKSLWKVTLSIAGLLLLPACNPRYINFVKCSFTQPDTVECCLDKARCALRCTRIYNVLQTIDLVYALWISDDVRALHDCLVAPCKNNTNVPEMTYSEKEPNSMVFYVLMNSDYSAWSYVLHIGDRCFTPSNIRPVDLDHGYLAVFGEEIMRFKRNAYEITFDIAPHTNGAGKPPFSLELFQGTISATMLWCSACDEEAGSL